MAGEWTTVRLGDICRTIYRYPSFYGMEKHSTGVPVIRGEHLLDSGHISDDWNDYWFVSKEYSARFPKTELEEHDIVMSVRGTVGQFARVGPAHVGAQISPNTIRISPDPRKVHPQFLYHAFRAHAFGHFLQGTVATSAVPGLRAGDIKEAPLTLPPLAEQKIIAEVLGALDDKIELNRRMNAMLEAMARALFQSWFVDFDPVRAKLDGRHSVGVDQATATLFPDRFAHGEHDMLPVGWRLAAIEEVCAINAWTLGKNDDLETLEYVEISEVSRGNVANIATYQRGKEPSRARRRLRHGDTALSTVRPDRGSYFLALRPPENRVASTGFSVPTPTKVPWSFIHSALTQPEVSDHLGQMADGGAYPAVRPEIIGAMQVPLPNEPKILESFHQTCAPLFEKAHSNRAQSRTLATLRDTLLPKLLSGQV